MLTPGSFEHRRSIDVRLRGMRIGAVVLMSALAISFWVLQVSDYLKYSTMAENNNLRTIPLRAPRGVLYDRNGRVLVESRDTFTIAIIRERSSNLGETVQRLAAAVNVEEKDLRDILQRAKQRGDPMFRPVAVIDHATEAQVAAVTARKIDLPEVVVQRVPTRAYPPERLGAHAFGYVSEISEAQLGRPEFEGLSSGDIIGQTGLERTYNPRLMGHDGNRFVAVDSRGREIGELRQQEDPTIGERLKLTLDYDMQKALDDWFRVNDLAGAAIFMDPRNGEILALTSQPSYDPNVFAGGIDKASLAALSKDPLKPFQNRLIQGMYSPGSTFKILMATAALTEGVITPDTTFFCPGSAVFYGHSFACDKKTGHGRLNLRQAIEQSCNVYFFNVADRLTVDQIHDYAAKLGLVGKTGIDLPGEGESILPSTEWRRRTSPKDPKWYASETISVGIGQGPVTLTPVALATMMATIANGGTVVTPHLVKEVDAGDGWKPMTPPKPRSVFPLKPDVLEPVRDGLWMVVNHAGTGSGARIEGRDVVGKTGTAQVISNEGKAAAAGKTTLDLRDNSWFVFFAPRDNPQIAGVVFVEHGGHGGTTSAPIAKFVLQTFFAKQDGLPLPALPMPVVKKPETPR